MENSTLGGRGVRTGSFSTLKKINNKLCLKCYAVLEVAQNVFSIGLGLTSMDLIGLKLMRGVERVEKKVDKLLKSGLKVAAIHYDSAADKIMGKKYKDAFSKLDKVINEATKAFVHIEEKEITIESFKECINSVVLITF